MPPTLLQYLLLAVLGAAIGSLINWAIYQWAITMHRPISPWMKPRPDWVDEENAAMLRQLDPRSFADCIPIFGWLRLRRDGAVVEDWKWEWVRPLLIEITWLIGLPLFFWWQHAGGLVGVDPATGIVGGATAYSSLATPWFWLHTILIALMFIATFIDFDEQMIPDQVTVPGTILALIVAAVFIDTRLPITGLGAVKAVGLVDFASPKTAGGWEATTTGLLSCLGIFTVWIWGLLPKRIPSGDFKLGIIGWFKILLASIVRPARKTKCKLRTKPRTMQFMTKLYLLMFVVGAIALVAAWQTSWMGPTRKLSLVSAFIGMAVAGGLIWGIRIVGSYSLGQEAMGFGDVTLMCMIGAFLGWQASLVGFVYSIFFAVVLAIILMIITKKSYLAFGPYLCMGSLLALLRWPSAWQDFAEFFHWGPGLLGFFGGSLVLMVVLLPIVRWLIRGSVDVEDA